MSLTVKWYGPEVKREMRRRAVLGLYDGAEHVLGVSDLLVPLEEATLERSGVASVDQSRLKAAVSYDTPYAVRQHEELGWKHDAGRQAKYLEQPLNSERPALLKLLQRALRGESRS